jgi:hypothetical protein
MRDRTVTAHRDGEWTQIPAWQLTVQLGPGGGRRWIDFPGYSHNVAAPWWRHLSLTGRGLIVARNPRVHFRSGTWRYPAWAWKFTKAGNTNIYPRWWV